MNKTADIQEAIAELLVPGPTTLDKLMGWLGWVGDPRWIMVALVHLRKDGRIRWLACDPEHGHDGACMVTAVAR